MQKFDFFLLRAPKAVSVIHDRIPAPIGANIFGILKDSRASLYGENNSLAFDNQ